MKILMVSTFVSGGATIAARRQAKALIERGIECCLVCVKENWEREDVHVTKDGYQILINVPAFSWNYSGKLTTAYCKNNRSDVSNTWFSFWPTETLFDEQLLNLCAEFDVIHFHWISLMVSSKFTNQLAKLNKRVVFTSHDMNHFTGGCHYNAGCREFETGCDICPHLLSDPLKFVETSYLIKIAALRELNATWLFPSQWLLDEFILSKLSKKTDVKKLLRNCLDVNKFTYLQENARDAKREELGFYKNELVYVAGAADNTEKRKGFEHLNSGIQQLSTQLNISDQQGQRLVIVTFGHGDPKINTGSPRIRHQHLGVIDENQMISLLQSSDLMIFPSVEENFSNLILESLMCGCPVLGFRIGGVPDIVVPNVNGHLVNLIDTDLFGDAMIALASLERIKDLRVTTRKWRDINTEFYCYDHIANELIDVYREISLKPNTKTDPKVETVSPKIAAFQSFWGLTRRKETNMAYMLTENIVRYVRDSKSGEKNEYSKRAKLDAIFKGYSDSVQLDLVGRAAWILQDNLILFNVNDSNRPALCIQIPNVDWIVNFLNQALAKLQVSTNFKESKYHISKQGNNCKFIYLWIVPGMESFVKNAINCLRLNFDGPSIPYKDDQRGLCILFSQVALVDLNYLESMASDSFIPDYATSNALNLKITQTECIWQGWNEKTNELAYLPSVISMWSEVLFTFTDQLENNV